MNFPEVKIKQSSIKINTAYSYNSNIHFKLFNTFNSRLSCDTTIFTSYNTACNNNFKVIVFAHDRCNIEIISDNF